MQIFRPIEHAITDDGEWITVSEIPADYMGELKCDRCHASVVVIKKKSGEEEFVHSRHTMKDIIKTRSCGYAIRTPAPSHLPGTEMVVTKPTQEASPALSIPPIGPRILQFTTAVRKWRCVWCKHCYYGTKQCPLCNEWTYSIEC